MLNYIKNLFFLSSLILGVYGCTAPCRDCDLPLSAEVFFPTTIGQFVEYNVREEQYNLGQPATITTYQLKEVLTETISSINQQPVYKIVRYRRATDSQAWQLDSTFALRFMPDHIVRNEHGREFVKMISPVTEKSQWNANRYNNLGEDVYELKNVNKPYAVKNVNFEQTATVLKQNDSTLVGQDKRIEVYAKGVGLIYKELVSLQFCSSGSCVGKAQIDFGRRLYMSINKTGVQ